MEMVGRVGQGCDLDEMGICGVWAMMGWDGVVKDMPLLERGGGLWAGRLAGSCWSLLGLVQPG